MLIELVSLLFFIFVGLFAFWRFWFLRNPEREIPLGRNIVSPADGIVIMVWKYSDEEIEIKKGRFGRIRTLLSDVGPKGWIISIGMNPMDVHYNRSPVPGKVLYANHSPGKLLPMLQSMPEMSFRHGLENEKNEILIKNKILGKIKVIQIAGRLARRIECFVKKGQEVKKGQRVGLINLGSQCTLILPKNVKPTVKAGDRVKAGSDVIATY